MAKTDNPTFYGQDLTGTSANMPLGDRPSVTGLTYFDQTNRRLMVVDNESAKGLCWPVDGGFLHSASSPRIITDDFRGADLYASGWEFTSGSDAQALDGALVAGAPSGEIQLVSGNAGTGIAADGSVMCGPIDFECEEGEINAYWKMKIDNASDVWFFLGFTDVLPGTTLEEPASLSGTTYTTTASDACGFLFDTDATTDTIRLVGVAGDTDATHVDTSVAPGTAYREYRLRLTTAGVLTGWIDGTKYTDVASAVTVGTDIGFFAGINARTTTSKTMTLDAMQAH